jgi:glutathione S-transferase
LNFGEHSFRALGWIGANRRPGFYALRMTEERRVTLEPKRRLGYAALGVMEGRLKGHNFFVGDHYSIAGIALHAYTHVAHESGFDLGR